MTDNIPPQSGDDAKAEAVTALRELRTFLRDCNRCGCFTAEEQAGNERYIEERLEPLTVALAAPAKPDLSALIAEVMEEQTNRHGYNYQSKYAFGYNDGTKDFAEKLTAALKDKGV